MKLKDSSTKWRRIQKTLDLMEFLMLNGNKHFAFIYQTEKQLLESMTKYKRFDLKVNREVGAPSNSDHSRLKMQGNGLDGSLAQRNSQGKSKKDHRPP